jgi:hypothetical protein
MLRLSLPLLARIGQLDPLGRLQGRCRAMGAAITKRLQGSLVSGSPFMCGDDARSISTYGNGPVFPVARYRSCEASGVGNQGRFDEGLILRDGYSGKIWVLVSWS